MPSVPNEPTPDPALVAIIEADPRALRAAYALLARLGREALAAEQQAAEAEQSAEGER